MNDKIENGEWTSGRTILDDFVVERVLGEGGMGKVYLLKNQTTGMRFAVKRAKGLSDADRRNFLAELQTWIDLPEHPNLVPCRFFRTVGDEVLIFAEYVAGGSLKDWIDSGKLYEGGKEKALERILDTAIQFAWGLHCVHELGLVHQDVKPANVMMGSDTQADQSLKAMVSDYGLARARASSGERYEPEIGRSILVSSGGYTPAYCSPEQLASHKLDRRSDLWSWGVSVLEMFHGEVTWRSGSVAAEALESFLEHNGENEYIPAMPSEAADILRNCFCVNLDDRWKTLDTLVQKLSDVYQMSVGSEFKSILGKIAHKDNPLIGVGERQGKYGDSWTDPLVWLKRALKEDGREPTDAAEIVAHLAISRRGQLVADMAVYDEARRIYERLITEGRKGLELALAGLCDNAAYVHLTADDTSGSSALYSRAIELNEQLINIEGQSDIAKSLAMRYCNKAVADISSGDKASALLLFNKAISLLKQLVNDDDDCELAYNLSMAYRNKANLDEAMGDNILATELSHEAILILERLVNEKKLTKYSHDLAMCYFTKGNAACGLRYYEPAVTLYDQAIEICERLVNVEMQIKPSLSLAKLYSNKSVALSSMGDIAMAVATQGQAVEILERMVNVYGRSELAGELAMSYQSKACALNKLGDHRLAVALHSQAIDIIERLIKLENRIELTGDLANCYLNKANALCNLGDAGSAVTLQDQGIEILVRLVKTEDRREYAKALAKAYTNKAGVLSDLGDNRSAVVLYDEAIEMLGRLVNVYGRCELVDELASIKIVRTTIMESPGETLNVVQPEMLFVKGGLYSKVGDRSVIKIKAYLLSKYQVTYGEWKKVYLWALKNLYTFENTGDADGNSCPVYSISLCDVYKWCNARSEMENLDAVYLSGKKTFRSGTALPVVNAKANGYRLPTDAEWEWAAMGGIYTHNHKYSGSNNVDDVAWYDKNSKIAVVAEVVWRTRSSPVGMKMANELGFHDMSGNLWEFCDGIYFQEGLPAGHSIRGGSHHLSSSYCSIQNCNGTNPGGGRAIGFRPARNTNSTFFSLLSKAGFSLGQYKNL